MSYDELELDTLGDRKSALFLIMSDTDSTFNFVIAMLQSQLFNLLCDKADDEYNGKLPVHVRFLLDEFANIGQIPRFDKLIATIRSREMSASIILQSQSQLKAIYKDAAEIILDNADSTLFLGGRGKNAKDISDNLGRETIDSFNTSEKSRHAGFSWTYLSKIRKGYAILVREEFSCLEFIMNRDTINWILKKLNTGGRTWSIYQENPSKRHQLHAGGRLLHPRFEAAGGKPPHWTVGRMHKAFLQEHRPGQYNALLSVGKTLDISC